MPSFTQPATYTTIDITPKVVPLGSIAFIQAVIKERLLDFLTYPHMFSDLTLAQATAFFERLKDNLYTDPAKLRQDAKAEWCLITPITIQEDRTPSLSPALNVQNSVAPTPLLRPTWVPLDVGSVPSSAYSIIQRSIIIAVCQDTRTASFRAGDAIYMWLISICPLLRNEFDVSSVVAKGLRGVSEAERHIFAKVPGDPVVIQMNIWKPSGFEYSAVSPV